MKSYNDVCAFWNPLHLLYLGLIDFDQALDYSSSDTRTHSSNYPLEVSHS